MSKLHRLEAYATLTPSQRTAGDRDPSLRRDGSSEVTATLPQVASRLLAEMLIEKLGNLAERDGGLGQAIVEQVLRVRLAFIHL
jgi:hypothetical protein